MHVERERGISMIDPLAQSIINLIGHARSFQASIAAEAVEELVRDASRCEEVLQQLYTYVEKQNIALKQYYSQIVTINGSFQQARQQIQQKIDQADPSELPLWMQALGSINVALRVAASLTHLARRAEGSNLLQRSLPLFLNEQRRIIPGE